MGKKKRLSLSEKVAGRTGKTAKPGKAKSGRSERTSRYGPRRGVTVAVVAIVLVGLLATGGVYGYRLFTDQEEDLGVADTVTIETTKGTIVMEIYPELMPVTVANFEKLAGESFYDGLVWHRVENWVIQTGAPTTGMGGSVQAIKLETSPKLKNVRGGVGMARSTERDSATSQFYILKSDASLLDGDYAVFGKVVQGMGVVDQLTVTDKMTKVTVVRGQAGTE